MHCYRASNRKKHIRWHDDSTMIRFEMCMYVTRHEENLQVTEYRYLVVSVAMSSACWSSWYSLTATETKHENRALLDFSIYHALSAFLGFSTCVLFCTLPFSLELLFVSNLKWSYKLLSNSTCLYSIRLNYCMYHAPLCLNCLTTIEPHWFTCWRSESGYGNQVKNCKENVVRHPGLWFGDIDTCHMHIRTM